VFHGRYVPRIKPFLYCAHRMFFAGHGWHAGFLRACTDRFGGQADAKMTQMFGHPVLSIFPYLLEVMEITARQERSVPRWPHGAA